MIYRLNEVHTTIIVFMVIMTLILVIFIPRHSKVGKVYDNARNMLLCVTVLTIIHFIVQYYFHHLSVPELPLKRTVVNLLFGIPISFFMNMAVLYILRDGKINLKEWLIAPMTLSFALALFLLSEFTNAVTISLYSASVVIAVMYGITLICYHVLQIKAYFEVKKNYNRKNRIEAKWLNWHKWSIILLTLLDTGLPFMTFNLNVTQRYFYGIFALFVAFFVMMRFIIFGYTNFAGILKSEDLTDQSEQGTDDVHEVKSKKETVVNEPVVVETVMKEQHADDVKLQPDAINVTEETEAKSDKHEAEDVEIVKIKESLSPVRIKMISAAAEKMIESGYYLNIGITMKDVAEQMGVPRNFLAAWLQTTEHKQFNKWLMYLRIEEAKRLLMAHPDWSNEAVARSCGYSDRSYFQKQFRTIEGITPAKWYEQNSSKPKDWSEKPKNP